MIRRITQDQFTALCKHVVEKTEAEKKNPVCLVVVDEAGDVVYMYHMDGCPSRSGKIAGGKAFSAAKMERSTTALADTVKACNCTLADFMIPGMTILPGGSVLRDNAGEMVGAIGVSGRSAVEDQACADDCAAFIASL